MRYIQEVLVKGSGSGIKRVVIELREEDHAILRQLKGNKTWRDFIFELVEFKQKAEKEKELIARTALKDSYLNVAKGLNELGKLISYEEEGYKFNEEFYLASLLPLIVSGEEVDENDLLDLYVLVTNLVLNYLKNKYRDSKMYVIFEYLRVALIRELKGDSLNSSKFLKEMCRALGELS